MWQQLEGRVNYKAALAPPAGQNYKACALKKNPIFLALT